jgi:opacity protein-like surface antigen
MTRAKSTAVLTVLAASLALAAGAHAGPGRAGHGELMFGLGGMTSKTVSVDGFDALDAGDGTTFDVRFQFHFTDNLGIQVEGMGERESTRFLAFGCCVFSGDTDTRFFLVNALFDLMPGPVTPYFAIGVGTFSHRGVTLVDVNGFPFTATESGGAFDAAFGFQGHTRGPLVWAFEGRYLNYKFSDFQDDFNRYQFSGHLGFRF